jgi:DNA sulfur modification protein DndD
MLQYKKIIMENFGSYRNIQSFELPQPDGVASICVVYALNGRGKTTLLNAFKFAFTGEVYDKKQERDLEMKELFNQLEVESDDSRGSVELHFDYIGKEYIINRELNKTSSISQNEYSLMEDGNFLNDNQKDTLISRIMPKQLVKFFLFDAAQLQSYSALIANSERSREIRNAIDDALGLPYFQKSLNSLKEVRDFYQKEKAKLAKKDSRNLKIIEEIGVANELKDEKEEKLNELEAQKDKTGEEINSLREKVEKNKDEHESINKLIELGEKIGSIDTEIRNQKEKINESLKVQWFELLKSDLKNKRSEMMNQEFMKNFNSVLFDFLEMSIQKEKCELCKTDIKGNHKEHLEKLIKANKDFVKPFTLINNLLSDEKYYNDILEFEKNYNELSSNLMNFKNDRDGLRKEGIKEDNPITNIFQSYDNALSEETSIKQQIDEIKNDLKGIISDISTLNRTLTSHNDEESSLVENKIDITGHLIHVMEASLNLHREDMSTKIEKSASDWFSKATHLGYSGLEINHNYGLNLKSEDGRTMKIKSDGTEHMISLALIQALYRNAPVSGPLMIDSPIGQLDKEHKKRMLQELPSINDQIVLLVHEGELSKEEARRTFKSLLKKEFVIESVNNESRHSQIIPL